ncbi:hypothetical protein [Burkholderia sp. Ac-20365]|uniref:hypothetical protein n=1 Tax=Burkholderia sp. Ac-20365 TaxID=2703897 RepID=UPI00197C6C98|nr:hypothetical protein [Burkholderia sp. Ac-20365]MBN3761055.1 hypothetical protein [Burkholderia sp. Ac-20365]
MEITTLKKWLKSPTLKAGAITAAMVMSQAAMAQSVGGANLSGLCIIPQILKYIVGIVAMGALLLWAVAHMNSKNELSDLTIKIAVPCVLAGIVGYLITQFGLSASCSGI